MKRVASVTALRFPGCGGGKPPAVDAGRFGCLLRPLPVAGGRHLCAHGLASECVCPRGLFEARFPLLIPGHKSNRMRALF